MKKAVKSPYLKLVETRNPASRTQGLASPDQGDATQDPLSPPSRHAFASIGADEPPDFEAVYRRFLPYVAAIASRLIGRGNDEVEDVIQEVFVAFLRSRPPLASMNEARLWLSTVTHGWPNDGFKSKSFWHF